eukprot:CAMPEP_0179483666 /NCGR_PEP_ID=MMETSP0799-20121207/60781_1 /TAXON_ID=46947 /ORGANISM="Geminigera cryophila, Strain CCMP2564" /LENGTH=549 /DNA_ID=CAMNT_0021297275 /DNA_START=47 /DNA_END=1693 /DNA_ORIENTATION=-
MSSASRSGLYAGLVMRGTPATTECAAGSPCSLMMMPRLRGGSNKIDIDETCQLDPTRIAVKDKLGNHVVVSLAKGWPAALSAEIFVGDILVEVDEEAVAHLSTTALVQNMRGFEGAPIHLLLQRGEARDFVGVVLERVLQGIVDPADPEKKSMLETTIDMGLSMSGKATSMFSYRAKSQAAPQPATAAVQSSVAGVGIGFSCDEEANFVVSKIVAGGPAALSKLIKVGDVMVSVDGMDLDDMSIKDLIKTLKGPVGTSVELDLTRAGKMVNAMLTRDHVVTPVTMSSSSMAAGLFNSVSAVSAMATSSISSLSSISGGATAALTGSLSSGLSSITTSLSSLSLSSRSAAVSAADNVGVGLGIKKNQHGDFMIMDIVDGGAAALTSKVAVGDILQKVDKTSVAGIKSATLRDLILGAPLSSAILSLCRWVADGDEGGEWKSYQVLITRQKKPRRAAPAVLPAAAAAAQLSSATAAAAARPRAAAASTSGAAGGASARGGASAGVATSTSAPSAAAVTNAAPVAATVASVAGSAASRVSPSKVKGAAAVEG